MTLFRVWAPKPKTVEIVFGSVRLPMTVTEDGWWQVEANAPAGTDYAFSLDGNHPVPDPRSPFQPTGVHGPSRTVDHAVFTWTDDGWRARPLASALIYELHIGTFTLQGTFEAAIERLEYLVELGVTHVELMPVVEFPGDHGWGYDGVDLYAPHHSYGGPEGLKKLVNACHVKGLAVLLDVVYNHLGPNGNYLGQFGPYFTSRYSTPWGQALNFDDAGSDEVRRFFIENALMWLRDYHFDGLRLDAVHAILDTSATHILEELANEVKSLEAQMGRPLALIAESDLNDPRLVRPLEVGGYGLDAQWSDDFHHALHSLLTGERSGYYADFGSVGQLAKALTSVFVYDGCYSAFRQRRHGRSPVGIPPHHFLGYLQNHDQIGNRAVGERASHLLHPDLLKIGATIMFCSPFIPMLFQGEEWAASTPFLYFTDHQDPELGKAVSEGRRKEFAAFGWQPDSVPDPQASDTYQRSQLNWDELNEEPHASLLAWYKHLIQFRCEYLLTDTLAAPAVWFGEAARWLVIERKSSLVICNLLDLEQEIPLKLEIAWRVALTSKLDLKLGKTLAVLPPLSVAILVTDASPVGEASSAIGISASA